MVSLGVLKEYYFENAKLPIFTFFFRHLTANSVMRSGRTWPHLKKWKNKHLVFILKLFKTCELLGEGGCVSSSSPPSFLACSAAKAALSSSCTLSREHDDPCSPARCLMNGYIFINNYNIQTHNIPLNYYTTHPQCTRPRCHLHCQTHRQ